VTLEGGRASEFEPHAGGDEPAAEAPAEMIAFARSGVSAKDKAAT
jgi:hypothetical protein